MTERGYTDDLDTGTANVDLDVDTETADPVDETQGGIHNRPPGPDFGEGPRDQGLDDDGPLDDETPGSQGEIDPGSEGDFGRS